MALLDDQVATEVSRHGAVRLPWVAFPGVHPWASRRADGYPALNFACLRQSVFGVPGSNFAGSAATMAFAADL